MSRGVHRCKRQGRDGVREQVERDGQGEAHLCQRPTFECPQLVQQRLQRLVIAEAFHCFDHPIDAAPELAREIVIDEWRLVYRYGWSDWHAHHRCMSAPARRHLLRHAARRCSGDGWLLVFAWYPGVAR